MNRIKATYEALLSAYGTQEWWPTTTKEKETEIAIGAILTQNTAWKNVEKAIKNLADKGLVDIKKLNSINEEELAKLIRASGYYNQKAKKLKAFARHIAQNYGGEIKLLLSKNTEELRKELLEMYGIGPETADSIILYAAKKPTFIADAYTKRMASRTGIIKETASYDEIRNLFTQNLPKEQQLFSQYHALIVQHGKNTCKKTPQCENCPIRNACRYYANNNNI